MADPISLGAGLGIGAVVVLILKGRKTAISEVVGSAEQKEAMGAAISKGHEYLLESTRLRDVIDCRVDHKIRTTEMIFGERLNAVQRDISRLERAQQDGQREVMDALGRVFARLDHISEQTANVRGRLASHTDEEETEFPA